MLKTRLLPLLIIAGFMLVFFYKLAFSDLILARGDTYVYFYPYWDARNAALRSGELPLWTPDLFMGAPLLANPQHGAYYPFNWLTIPFAAPDAVRISILLHVIIAGIGVYGLFRAAVANDTISAHVAALLYAFGGYTGAHVEQINQLQGLAWLPWLLWALHRLLEKHRQGYFFPAREILLLALLLALQIFTGHTQTVFISGAALGLMALASTLIRTPGRITLSIGAGLTLLIAALFAAILALPQILPTLELTGLSNRGGGFNPQQATAFSLPPSYLGRALLPGYDGLLFGEYVAYIGVVGLGLAGAGILIRSRDSGWKTAFPWIILAAVGLLFALGRFNPIYALLTELPGFNLFRVPARWLSLFALGAAMLAGIGVLRLKTGDQPGRSSFWGITAALAGLMLIAWMVPQVIPQLAVLAEDISGPVIPTLTTLLGWIIALAGWIILLRIIPPNYVGAAATAFILVELFAAGQQQPYHDLAPRDVYTGQRLSISQMLAYQQDQVAPGRMLAISGLFFDPGDRAALEARFLGDDLSDEAVRHAFVAIKRQEMIFPNLPLSWGLPSLDGFDGGVLPTTHFTQFSSLLLPEGTLRSIDGRLGELLARPECRGACIPDERYLDLTDTRYLILDKVYDLWHEGIAYDTGLPISGENASLWRSSPPFTADTVSLIFQGESPPQIQHGEESPLDASSIIDLPDSLRRADYALPAVREVESLRVIPAPDTASVLALTLIDRRAAAFAQLTPEPYERVLSSDVKMYRRRTENLRARVFYQTLSLPEDWQGSEDALKIMASAEYDPAQDPLILHGGPALSASDLAPHSAEIVSYSATMIEIVANARAEGFLLLADSYYPGWTAVVNGETAEIYRANVAFRAVPVPAGESRVIFRFEPALWRDSLIVGGAAWFILGALFIIVWMRNRFG